MVEFVLISGVLMLMLLGMCEIALVLHSKMAIMAAAREGARRAAIEGGCNDKVLAKIREELQIGFVDVEKARVSVTPTTASYGTYVTVQVDYQHPIMTPLIREVVGHWVPLRGIAVSRSEKVR